MIESMKYSNSLIGEIVLSDGTKLKLESESNSRNPHKISANLKDLSNYISGCLQKNNRFDWEVKEINFKLNLNNGRQANDNDTSEMNEEDFFYYLLRKTEVAFHNSKTKLKYPKANWNFAICDTPIQKGKGLFFGLNWGGENINQQTVYPDKHKPRNWKFINNSRGFFKEFLNEEIEDLNYSNLCFFRSPSLKELEETDWELAIPLFEKYVNYANPAWCLMLGSPNELKQRGLIKNIERVSIVDSKTKNRVFGFIGKLFGKYSFGSVPHTESRISKQARNDIWKIVSEKIK